MSTDAEHNGHGPAPSRIDVLASGVARDLALAPRPPAIDTDNLLSLMANAQRLGEVLRNPPSAAERETLVQSLGERVEQAADALIRQVRQARGIDDSRVRASRVVSLVPPPRRPELFEPVSSKPAKLTHEWARRIMGQLGTFTLSELAAELECTQPTARAHIKIALSAMPPVLRPDGKIGPKPVWTFIPPPVPPDPTEHPTKPPPERVEGYKAVPKRGEAVRVSAAAKSTRRSRSTPGTRHQIIMRDRRYEEAERVRSERAEQARAKASRKAQERGRRKPR